jgi:hypothetical protein
MVTPNRFPISKTTDQARHPVSRNIYERVVVAFSEVARAVVNV